MASPTSTVDESRDTRSPFRRPQWLCKAVGGALEGSVLVAVVDSGYTQADRPSHILAGRAFLPGPSSDHLTVADDDLIGHGTACADLVHRVAPACRILPLRVFHDDLETTAACVAEAISYATVAGARVINLSLGSTQSRHAQTLYRAVAGAVEAGAIVVAAARGASYPAAFAPVIGVAASTAPDPFEYWYHHRAAVECTASAIHQWMRTKDGRRQLYGGASMAAPIISALSALVVAQRSSASVAEVREWLAAHAADARRRDASLTATDSSGERSEDSYPAGRVQDSKAH